MSISASALKGDIGRFQLFAIGFGSIVGSAWVVVLNQWLGDGGPGGTLLGFIAGGVVVLAVGACYAELTARIPVTGGEFIFLLQVFGRRAGFFAGWFIALAWICITIFEGLAISWFTSMLLPAWSDRVLYTAFGSPVTRNQILLGSIGALLIATVNFLGANMAARVQSVLTYGFLAIALAVLVYMVTCGHVANLQPLFPNTRAAHWWTGTAVVFANCAFLLNGFQAVSQVVEERSAHLALRSLASIMLATIAAAVLFYCLAVLAASSVVPWITLAKTDLAMVSAASALPAGESVATAILIAATASLLKTWNGVFLVGARTLVALARFRMLPERLAQVSPRSGAPMHAVLVIGALNILGLTLGRGAISALVDMTATSIVFCFILCSIAVPIVRRASPSASAYRVVGGPWSLGVAIVGSILMTAAALVTPFFRHKGLPLEHVLLISWGVVGSVFWSFVGRRHLGGNDLSIASQR